MERSYREREKNIPINLFLFSIGEEHVYSLIKKNIIVSTER